MCVQYNTMYVNVTVCVRASEFYNENENCVKKKQTKSS